VFSQMGERVVPSKRPLPSYARDSERDSDMPYLQEMGCDVNCEAHILHLDSVYHIWLILGGRT
jgi:hypothetical protein